MSVPQLPGLTYDPVRKRYFKEQAGDRKNKKESKLPDGLNRSVAHKEYVKCVDALIEGHPLPRPEWFRFQNKTLQLATTYTLPSFISQQGPSEIQMGRTGHSIILNDASFRLFELSIDESDDSFKVSFNRDSSAHETVTYFKTCDQFTISINRFNDFNFNTEKIMAGGKLKLPEVIDVNSFENETDTYLLFLSSRAYQLIQYNGTRLKTSKENKLPKKFGDAMSCILLGQDVFLIGFRNGSVMIFDTGNNNGGGPKAYTWFKSDGPIISITRTANEPESDLLLSIGKYPFQKLILLNHRGKILAEFQSRYSNLSKNKEILSIIRNEELHCALYGKRLETEVDMFSLNTPNLKFPVNLNWNWAGYAEILDILPYNREETVLFPLEKCYIRKRSIANVIFHKYNTYGLDSTRVLILIRDNHNSLEIKEYVF